MAASCRSAILGVVLLAWLTSSCTYLHGENFAVGQTEDGMVQVLACTDSLPATATVWRVGPNQIAGDDDDLALWGPEGEWAEDATAVGEVMALITSVAWEAGLYIVVSDVNSPTRELPAPLPVDEVIDFDGKIQSRQDFASNCVG